MKITLSSYSEISVKPTESFANFDLYEESLENISKSFPDVVDLDINTDLVPVCFPLLVANMFNKNGEAVSSEAAVKIADTLVHKFTDIDHDRKQVVGHIVGTSFSQFNNDHAPLTREEALASTEPFNVNCYAVVYEKVNPVFAKELRNYSQASSPNHKRWSASWEISYDNFDIGVGQGLLKDVEILKGQEAYSNAKYLKKNKGPGFNPEGQEVRRIIGGNVLGLAAGFTQRPAAAVKGVVIADFDVEDDFELESSSHYSEVDVKNNRNKKVMDEILEQLKQLLAKHAPQESQASTLTATFAELIKQKSEEWVSQKNALELEKSNALAEVKKQADLVQSNASQLEQALEEIKNLKEAQAQSLASETFNSRMAEIDEKFELKAEARPLIAKRVNSLSVDSEAFASYLDELTILLPVKSPVDESAASEADIQARVDALVEARIPDLAKRVSLSEEDVKTLLSNASEEKETVTNSSASNQQSLKERFKASLKKEDITITH